MSWRDFVQHWLPWIMSIITLYMTFLQGRKTWKAWAIGLINQLLWLAFIMHTRTWGLLLLNAGLWVLYVRNLRIWYNDEHQFMQRHERAFTPPRRWYEKTDELRKNK